MCDLYSITTNQAAIIALFRVVNRYVGNLSRIAQLDQRTALPDQCLHSAEADVRPPRRKSGFDPGCVNSTPGLAARAFSSFRTLQGRRPRVSYFAFVKFSNMSNTDQQLRNQGTHTAPITE